MEDEPEGGDVVSRHASVRGSAPADQGFTLVEVVVAVAIFVMVTAAALTALIAALNTVRENADRVQAASIARGILEDLQAQGADALLVDLAATDDTSLGAASFGVPVASPYTATVTAAWRSISQYVDPCVQGSELSTRTFLLATVTVDGGTLTAPEVIDGVVPRLKAEPQGDEPGSIAVRVIDSTGAGVGGIAVTISTGPEVVATGPTDVQGCLLVDLLAPGADYVVAVGQEGSGSPYRTSTLGETATVTVSVDAGVATPVAFVLDKPGRVSFVAVDDSYAVLPVLTFPIVVVPALSTISPEFGGSPVSLFPDTYQAWLGDCPDAGRRQVTLPVTADDSLTVALEGNLVQLLAPQDDTLWMRHVIVDDAALLLDDTTLSPLCKGLETFEILPTTGPAGGLFPLNVPTGDWIFAAVSDDTTIDDTVSFGAATPSPCYLDLGVAAEAFTMAKKVRNRANTLANGDDTDVTTSILAAAWQLVAAESPWSGELGDDSVISDGASLTIKPLFGGTVVARHTIALDDTLVVDDSVYIRASVNDTPGAITLKAPWTLAPACPVVAP